MRSVENDEGPPPSRVAGLRLTARCYSPALVKPAATADSSVSNQTSATVWSNHWLSGVWYFFESSLPLMGKPSGATSAFSSGTLDPAYLPDVPPSVSSKTSVSTPSTGTTISSAGTSATS